MKALKKAIGILAALSIISLAALKAGQAMDLARAISSLQNCDFTAELHVEENNPVLNAVLYAAGVEGNAVHVEGRASDGALYAAVYKSGGTGSGDPLTEIYADQSDCMVDAGSVIGGILKKTRGSQYVSVQGLGKLFQGEDFRIRMPETGIGVKELATQFKQCRAPEGTYYESGGYCFYECRESGSLVGIKKGRGEKYAAYLLLPGKAEASIQYSRSDSQEGVEMPEPAVPRYVFAMLESVLQKVGK